MAFGIGASLSGVTFNRVPGAMAGAFITIAMTGMNQEMMQKASR